MCPIKIEALAFDHIVEFSKDNTLFAAAREDSGKLRLFLIHQDTGNIYTRNGRADSWEELFGNSKELLITGIAEARKQNIPVYRINGYHNT
jgi:hypothetical protein